MAKRRSSRRGSRRRGHSRSRGSGGGFVLKELLMTGVIGGAGAVGLQLLMDKFLPADLKAKIAGNPYLGAAAVAGAGIAGGMVLRRFSPKLARGLALGGVVAGGTIAATQAMSGMHGISGVRGMGGMRGLGVFPSLPYDQPDRPMLNGLGNREPAPIEFSASM